MFTRVWLSVCVRICAHALVCLSVHVRVCMCVQAVFLQAFPAVYRELLKLFTVKEVASFIRETLGSLPEISQPDCPLEAVKLQCISKTVESHLYTNPGTHTRPGV